MRAKQIRYKGFRSGVKLTFLFFFLSVFLSLDGQAVPEKDGISLVYPVYSQYLQNGLMINPAYTGTRGSLSTFLSYRKQWIGTPGSPVIQSVSLHTPMKNDKVALGLMAQFMQYGATRSTSVFVFRMTELFSDIKLGNFFNQINFIFADLHHEKE